MFVPTDNCLLSFFSSTISRPSEPYVTLSDYLLMYIPYNLRELLKGTHLARKQERLQNVLIFVQTSFFFWVSFYLSDILLKRYLAFQYKRYKLQNSIYNIKGVRQGTLLRWPRNYFAH